MSQEDADPSPVTTGVVRPQRRKIGIAKRFLDEWPVVPPDKRRIYDADASPIAFRQRPSQHRGHQGALHGESRYNQAVSPRPRAQEVRHTLE